MSERAALAGSKGPPHTITHNDKTYVIKPVITDSVMLAVEAKLYEKAKAALASQRDMMSEEAYLARLDLLREKYELNGFAFESDATRKYLATTPGSVLLLTCMMDAPVAEIIDLLSQRGPEVNDILKTVLALSMPKEGAGPKQRARRR